MTDKKKFIIGSRGSKLSLAYSNHVRSLLIKSNSQFNDNSIVVYKGSHPAHDWKGVSSNVKGGIICEKEECVLQVIVPLESFDSGSSGRDSNMLFSTESHKYPYVKYYSDPFSMHYIRKEDFIVFSNALEAGLQKYLSKASNISVTGLNEVVEDALNNSSAKPSIRASVLNRIAEKSNSSKLLLSYLYDYLLCNKNQRVIRI